MIASQPRAMQHLVGCDNEADGLSGVQASWPRNQFSWRDVHESRVCPADGQCGNNLAWFETGHARAKAIHYAH
jgi:hypothetical protein